jgi:hypothetical protein
VTAAVAGVVCLIALNVVSLAREPRDLDVRPLGAYLLQRHAQAVFADYWVANRLTFETNERLAGVAVEAGGAYQYAPTIGPYRHRNRYAPYLRAALRARGVAWVLPLGAGEAPLRHLLVARHVRARRAVWGPFAVYTDLAPPVRPPDLGSGATR